jgi:uncharacterized membrane protein YeiH
VNSIVIHGYQLAGPFLDAVDLLATFVFALSGAAAGVKSRLDLFGLMALSFAAGNAGGITRDVLIGAVVLRKNSMPLSSQRDLTFRIASSRSFVSWLETLLVAEVYSPDRIFVDHRIDA